MTMVLEFLGTNRQRRSLFIQEDMMNSGERKLEQRLNTAHWEGSPAFGVRLDVNAGREREDGRREVLYEIRP